TVAVVASTAVHKAILGHKHTETLATGQPHDGIALQKRDQCWTLQLRHLLSMSQFAVQSNAPRVNLVITRQCQVVRFASGNLYIANIVNRIDRSYSGFWILPALFGFCEETLWE